MKEWLVAHLRKWWRLIVPVVFAALIIWRFDLREVAVRLAESDLRLIAISGVMGFGTMLLLWSWRWQLLLKSYGIHYPLRRAVKLYLIGMLAGLFFSSSLGAFIRGLYVKEDGYRVSKAMMTIFIDKVLELASLLIFGIIGLFVFPSLFPQRWVVWGILLGGMCSGVGFVWALRGFLGQWLSGKLDIYLKKHLQYTDGYSFSRLYNRLRAITLLTWVQTTLLSLAGRLAHYTAVYLLVRALDIPLSFLSTVTIMSLVGVLVALPISIAGGLGTRDGALVGLFVLLGQPSEAALSLSFLILACSLSWMVVGMVMWLKHPLRWRDKQVDIQSTV